MYFYYVSRDGVLVLQYIDRKVCIVDPREDCNLIPVTAPAIVGMVRKVHRRYLRLSRHKKYLFQSLPVAIQHVNRIHGAPEDTTEDQPTSVEGRRTNTITMNEHEELALRREFARIHFGKLDTQDQEFILQNKSVFIASQNQSRGAYFFGLHNIDGYCVVTNIVSGERTRLVLNPRNAKWVSPTKLQLWCIERHRSGRWFPIFPIKYLLFDSTTVALYSLRLMLLAGNPDGY